MIKEEVKKPQSQKCLDQKNQNQGNNGQQMPPPQLQTSAFNGIKLNVESDDSQENRDLVYPSVNIVCSPRIYQQKIRTDRVSLTRYKDRIYAGNCRKNFEEPLVPINYLTKFVTSDGMIFNMRDIRSRERNQNPVGAIKILVCVCMYNEDRHALQLTLEGLHKNLRHFQREGFSSGDIAVVLIQDGILKLVNNRQKRTFVSGKDSMVEFYRMMDKAERKAKCDLQERINVILDQMDNYSRKGMADFVARNTDFPPSIEKNVALLLQNTWYPEKTLTREQIETRQRERREDGLESSTEEANRKLRIFSCFKHINGTKLSSHLWFFEGFCRYIDPEFCVLLDVGTTPDDQGLVHLIKGFAGDRDVGGVTGFMSVDAQFKSQEGDDKKEEEKGFFARNCFSIEKAQEYEYIISHFLDKNSESALGFLHVLPGAWSAYRYKALIKSDGYEANLLQKSYFKMILNPNMQERDYMEANMYLAEDRILSLGIYCQTDSAYNLKYVPNAIAYTDPMKDHKNLMMQRRRWINSSLFAFLYVLRNYHYNVMESKHNIYRRYITLNLSMLIAFLAFVNTYFTPSLYFFILYSTVVQLGGYGSYWEHIAKTVSFTYVITFLVSVGGGLTGKAWTEKAHLVSYILSFFTFMLMAMVTYNILFVYLQISSGQLDPTNFVVASVILMLLINVGSSAIIILMHVFTHPKFVFKLFMDSMSYMVYQGAYSQVMVAHSFCNVDDVSWGTKGSTGAGGKKKYQVEKVFFVSSWLFYNALVSAVFIYIDIVVPAKTSSGGGSVLIGIAIYGSVFLLIKALLAIWYHFKWTLFGNCCLDMQWDLARKEKVERYWDLHDNSWRRHSQEPGFFSSMYRR